MRAYEYLFESADERTVLEKLKAVIDHPATETTIREVAQRKYDLLLAQESAAEEVVLPVSRISIPVNVDDHMLDTQFVTGVSIYDIYQRLCATKPSPASVEFSRMGTVRIVVPPPYEGLTKHQFCQLLKDKIPGVHMVSGGQPQMDKMGELTGYIFTLHYI